MHSEFEVHMLNDAGKAKAREIADAFDALLSRIEAIWQPRGHAGYVGREGAIVRTKLEEACFFAKKAMASNPENCQEVT